jgi:hypothetical protein
MPSAMIAESWWLIGDSSSKTCAVTACYTDRWAPGIGTHAEALVHGVPVNSFYSLQIGSREVLRWWSTKWCHKHGYAECGGIPASGLLPLPPTPIVSCLPAKLRLVEGREHVRKAKVTRRCVMSPELKCKWGVRLSVAYMKEPQLRSSIHFI